MKKLKKAAVCAACVILAAGTAAGVYFISARISAGESNNLKELDVKGVPAPAQCADYEADVALSEIKMHYAVYGEDERKKPLVLIHGNACSHKTIESAALYLANDFTVYSIDSRCHGESTVTPELSYELMAEDTKEFIDAKKLEKPYIVGHSDGGIIALMLASKYPDSVSAVVSCGANSNPDGLKQYFIEKVKLSNKTNPSVLNDIILTQPDLNRALLSKIKCPVYIVAGEHDLVKLSDTDYLHKNIKNSKEAIIKNADHSSYILGDGKKAYRLVKDFVDETEKD